MTNICKKTLYDAERAAYEKTGNNEYMWLQTQVPSAYRLINFEDGKVQRWSPHEGRWIVVGRLDLAWAKEDSKNGK